MGAFEEFVESNYFFPVLICLLALLIAIFVFILIIDRKKEKEYIDELKKELGEDDQTKTIQIPVQRVVKQVVIPKEKSEKEDLNSIDDKMSEAIENTKTEKIHLTQTLTIPVLKKKDEDKGLDLSSTVEPTVLKENPVNKKIEERTEIAEDAPILDLKIGDTKSDESLEATQVIQIDDSKLDDEEIKVEEVKQAVEDEGEEIAMPDKAIQIEDEGTSVIEIPKEKEDVIKEVEIEKPNAFEVKMDGNTDINEDIKYEPPKEYTGTKTEILDLSDIVGKEE